MIEILAICLNDEGNARQALGNWLEASCDDVIKVRRGNVGYLLLELK